MFAIAAAIARSNALLCVTRSQPFEPSTHSFLRSSHELRKLPLHDVHRAALPGHTRQFPELGQRILKSVSNVRRRELQLFNLALQAPLAG